MNEDEVADSRNRTRTRFWVSLLNEDQRRQTFAHWPRSAVVTDADLARDGFFYLGPGDRVQCVFCRRVLHSWQRGDVVHEEHRRISPNCPYLRGREVGNIPWDHHSNLFSFPSSLSSSGRSQPPSPPVTASYCHGVAVPVSDSESRASLCISGSERSSPPESAGFDPGSYEVSANHTVKYPPNDKIQQHPVRSSNQKTVLMQRAKGIIADLCLEFAPDSLDKVVDELIRHSDQTRSDNDLTSAILDAMEKDKANEDKTLAGAMSSPIVQAVLELQLYPKEKVQNLVSQHLQKGFISEQDLIDQLEIAEINSTNLSLSSSMATLTNTNDDDTSDLLCKVCMERNLEVSFIPCGHFACCQECAAQVTECPVCRSHIRERLRTYI